MVGGMALTRAKLVKAIIYLRLSDFRFDEIEVDEDGEQDIVTTFDGRERRLRELADQLGWEVYKVVIENDLNPKTGKVKSASAYKRRKVVLADGSTAMRVVRPGFGEVLDHLAAGRADGLLSEDLDRTMRDPRDLEDFIDIAALRKVNARSISGSLTFTDGGTDAEVTMARVMVTIANKSSRDTGRRVAIGRATKAHAGEFGGGPRPFGFEADGVTHLPAEAEVLLDCSTRVVKVDPETDQLEWTLKVLAAELRGKGVLTASGGEFSATRLRDILLRPRNAGIAVYLGEEVGPASWKPIVPVQTFRAVVRLLTDPSRVFNTGAGPKWFGTNLYMCGRCDDGRTSCWVTSAGNRSPRYICKASSHLTRNAQNLDRFVTDALLAKISQPGFIEKFVQRPEPAVVDLGALRTEAASIRVELNGLAEDRMMKLIDREQMLKGTARGHKRLKEISRLLSESVVESPLTEFIGVDDVRAVWKQQPLSIRRSILDTMATVTIKPVGRGVRGFVPESIDLSFKRPNSAARA